MALTRRNIIDSVRHKLKLTKSESVQIVESLLEIIKKNLANGEDLLITGFGKFRVRDKRKRKVRNPQTGEDMMMRSRRVVTFKCSGVLRDKINEKG